MNAILTLYRQALSQQLELALHNGNWKEEQRIQAELDRIYDIMMKEE